MTGEKVVVIGIIPPNDLAKNQQLVNVPIALDNFFRAVPGAPVHIGRLGENIGHVLTLLECPRGVIQMIGRHQWPRS